MEQLFLVLFMVFILFYCLPHLQSRLKREELITKLKKITTSDNRIVIDEIIFVDPETHVHVAEKGCCYVRPLLPNERGRIRCTKHMFLQYSPINTIHPHVINQYELVAVTNQGWDVVQSTILYT